MRQWWSREGGEQGEGKGREGLPIVKNDSYRRLHFNLENIFPQVRLKFKQSVPVLVEDDNENL